MSWDKVLEQCPRAGGQRDPAWLLLTSCSCLLTRRHLLEGALSNFICNQEVTPGKAVPNDRQSAALHHAEATGLIVLTQIQIPGVNLTQDRTTPSPEFIPH